MSAEEWAKNNGEAWSTVVGVIQNGNKVVCGKVGSECDLTTHMCLRCDVEVFDDGLIWDDRQGQHRFHFCVSRDTDIQQFAAQKAKEDTVSGLYWSKYKCSQALSPVNYDVTRGWTKQEVAVNKGTGVYIPGLSELSVGIAQSGHALIQTWEWNDEKGQKYCANGSDGKLYCIEGLGSDKSITYGQEKTLVTRCEILPVKLYNLRKCFFCPLFTVVYDASGAITDLSFSKLASGFATLIVLGLAVWIAFQTLTHVSSLTKQDAPKFLGNIIKQSYKFLIAFLLLQNSSQIFEYIVNPVLETGIEFGSQFLTEYKATQETRMAIEQEIGERSGTLKHTGHYDQVIYERLDRYVGDIQREISFMQAVGTSLVCAGNRGMFHETVVAKFADGFKMFIQGAVIAAFAFLLSIAFAFYMIDAVVQLGIVGGLAPFLVASWPFKITSQYAGTGFKMLLNSAFIFLFIGLTVSVNLNLISSALSISGSQKHVQLKKDCEMLQMCKGNAQYKEAHPDDCQKAEQAASEEQCKEAEKDAFGGLSAIAQAINSQDESQLIDLTDISGIGFLILLFCCIFGFKFMGQTSSLAGQFSSGGIKPTAPSIATMGGSAALSGAKKLTKPVREAVGRKAEDAEMAVIGAVAHPIKTAKSIGRGITSIANKFRGKKGGGSSESTSETESEETKSKKKSGTTENSGPQGSKKKGAVVGQKGGKGGETDSTKPSVPAGGGDNNNSGGTGTPKPGDSETGTTDNEAAKPTDTSEGSGASGQTEQKKNRKPSSRKQRKYPRKKSGNKSNKKSKKQRRNKGRRHK